MLELSVLECTVCSTSPWYQQPKLEAQLSGERQVFRASWFQEWDEVELKNVVHGAQAGSDKYYSIVSQSIRRCITIYMDSFLKRTVR